MNRNEKGVPCCPECKSTHNFFVSVIYENDKIIMTRLCHPCQEKFITIFDRGGYLNALSREIF